MKTLGVFLVFTMIFISCKKSVNEATYKGSETFNIRINRLIRVDSLIKGEIYVNDQLIGKCYENYYYKINTDTYRGLIRYGSQSGFSQNPLGQFSQEGDFLLEVDATLHGRTNILFHGGNKAKHSRGCILLGAVNRDPVSGDGYIPDPQHPLRKLRILFYGTEFPNSTPNKNIIITVTEPENF